MRIAVPSTHGLLGFLLFLQVHAGNKVVIVTTISTSGTMKSLAAAGASQTHVVRVSTTTGTGVITSNWSVVYALQLIL